MKSSNVCFLHSNIFCSFIQLQGNIWVEKQIGKETPKLNFQIITFLQKRDFLWIFRPFTETLFSAWSFYELWFKLVKVSELLLSSQNGFINAIRYLSFFLDVKEKSSSTCSTPGKWYESKRFINFQTLELFWPIMNKSLIWIQIVDALFQHKFMFKNEILLRFLNSISVHSLFFIPCITEIKTKR